MQVQDQTGFAVGASVIIDNGTPVAEVATIKAFGSLIFDAPLKFAHAVGAVVVLMALATPTTPAPNATNLVEPPTALVKSTLVDRLRAYGAPSCRQFPLRRPPGAALVSAPSCAGGVSTLSRSSAVANWFHAGFGTKGLLGGSDIEIEKPGFVLDLSSGCKGLRSALPAGIRYVPSSEFVPSCNYNDGLIPELKGSMAKDMSGVVVALGVLEQVTDVPSFLEALKSYYRPLVVSYEPVDTKDTDVSNRVSKLSTGQFRTVLKNLNLKASHQARMTVNGAPNLLYWFEPSDWAPFADSATKED